MIASPIAIEPMIIARALLCSSRISVHISFGVRISKTLNAMAKAKQPISEYKMTYTILEILIKPSIRPPYL